MTVLFLSLLCRLGTVFAVKSKSRVQRVVALWGHVHKSPEQVCTLHESGFHDVGPHLRTSSEALVPYPDPSFVFISYGSEVSCLPQEVKMMTTIKLIKGHESCRLNLPNL